MTSSQVSVRRNEFVDAGEFALPSQVYRLEPRQRGGGHAAPTHSTADACIGCVDWYSYDRLVHDRVVTRSQPAATR